MTSRIAARPRFFELDRHHFLTRAAAPAAAVALLAAMLALSRDFGATWDERALQKLGELIWDLYTGRMSRAEFLGTFELNFGYTRIYGLLVEFLSVAAQHVIPGDLWVVRHYVNAVFGWVGVVFAFLIGLRLFGVRAAWLAAALLVCMPRYIADSMNNPKDLPFAVLMLAGSYYILTIGAAYPFIVVVARAEAGDRHRARDQRAVDGAHAARLHRPRPGDCRRRGARIRHPPPAAGGGTVRGDHAVALIGGCAFWPWAQEQPLTRPIEAFFMASSFSWGNPSLFRGEAIPGTAVPWYYLPTWIGITMPAVVLIGLIFALFRLASVPAIAPAAGRVVGRRPGPGHGRNGSARLAL